MSHLKLQVLNEAEIQKTHKHTLAILENIGVRIAHAEALKKFKQAGAEVNEANGIVKMHPKLVSELLSQAPQYAKMTGLNGQTLEAGGDNKYYGSLILDPFIVDYNTGRRLPVLEDVRRHTIIGESLPRINYMARMEYPVSDLPEEDNYLKTMEVFLTHTTKHIFALPTSIENCSQWMDVAEVICDAAGLDCTTTPLMTVAVAVTSPLQLHELNVEIIKAAMSRCYPIIPTVCPMAGATSPYSMAGSMLLSNVEALMPVLVAQLYKPGHPVFYSSSPSVMDMNTGHDLYYKADAILFKMAANQMAEFYQLPSSAGTGGTLTHRPDMQNGAECFALILAAHTLKQNLVYGVGSLGNANGMSPEQIIMQCGLIDMAEFVALGIDTNEPKFAYDSIKNVGVGGNYLSDAMTLELLHSDEFFRSPYMDLSGNCIDSTPGMYEIAHQKVENLIKNYTPAISEKVVKAIENFVEKRCSSGK